MNQILVTDKVFITPEFKRKKKMYKYNFILSIVIIGILSVYCVYASYDMNKSEEVSQMYLADMQNAEMIELPGDIDIDPNSTMMRKEDNVIIVVLEQEEQLQEEEINIDDLVTNSNSVLNTETYYASNGTPYTTIAEINIPKIGVNYPILSQTDKNTIVELLKKSPCKFHGAEPNEIGNFCIVGHNYRNKKFFSKVPTLKNGDTVEITDLTGKTIIYEVYDKYEVLPDDVSCTDQRTNGRREITLITCTNDSKKRVIVKCVEQGVAK